MSGVYVSVPTTATESRAALRSARRGWRADAAALAVIVALVAVAFSPWWLGGRLLAPLDVLHETFAPWYEGDRNVEVHNAFTSDAVTQYLGYRAFAAQSFAQDGRIGWNDLTNAGRPEYANTMATYGDWTVQLHRFLDFWTAWHLGLLLQVLIAASGMYVLLRSQRLLPQVALIGAIAFAGSTPFMHTLYHRWQLGAFAWMPWTVWALLSLRHGARWGGPATAGFLALALLGGSLQTTVFVFLTFFGTWIGVLLDSGSRSERLRWTAQVTLWGLCAVGLAAFWLLPTILTYIDGLALHGERSALGYPHGWTQPFLNALFIPLQAVPTLLGSPRSLDLARVFHANLTNVAFFGLVPMLVAVRSIFWSRTPPAARVLILVGLLVPLTPLIGPLYHRVQIVFVFGGVWAFAYYWQHAPSSVERVWRILFGAFVALAAVWVLASVVVQFAQERVQTMLLGVVDGMIARGDAGQLAGFTEWMRARAVRVAAELMVWHPRQLTALAAAAIAVAAFRLRAHGKLRRASYVLFAAVLLELGGMAVSFVTFVRPQQYPAYPARADIEMLREEVSAGRLHIASRYSGPALLFPPNTLALYGIATIEQFETVDVPGMWQAAGYRTDAATLGRLGVTHAVSATDTVLGAGWRGAAQASTFMIWRNDSALPRYVAVPAGVSLASHLDALQSGSVRDSPVVIDTATFSRRVFRVSAGTAQIRVAENWAEGWWYSVDGGLPQHSVRAPDGSMLLTLEAQPRARRIEMWYQPQRRRVGHTISLLSAVVLLPLAFTTTRWQRRRRDLKQESGS